MTRCEIVVALLHNWVGPDPPPLSRKQVDAFLADDTETSSTASIDFSLLLYPIMVKIISIQCCCRCWNITGFAHIDPSTIGKTMENIFYKNTRYFNFHRLRIASRRNNLQIRKKGTWKYLNSKWYIEYHWTKQFSKYQISKDHHKFLIIAEIIIALPDYELLLQSKTKSSSLPAVNICLTGVCNMYSHHIGVMTEGVDIGAGDRCLRWSYRVVD